MANLAAKPAYQEMNGYTNYATWNVCLWIDNDRGMHEAKLKDLRHRVAQDIWPTASHCEAVAEIILNCTTPDLTDTIGERWMDVDWNQIAEEWTLEVKELIRNS